MYSTLNDDAPAWSAPATLVTDSLDNTCVQVRPFPDSAVMISWKRSNTVMGLRKTMFTSAPAETLAVSSSDSVEYDMSSKFGTTGLVWTSDVQGMMTPLYRWINRYSQVRFSTPETLRVPLPCYKPRLTVSQMADPTFFFETRKSGVSDIFFFLDGLYSPASLSGDPFSDNRNARSFNSPYITKQGVGAWNWPLSLFGLVVYEKCRGNDSSLVFLYGSRGDTVRTPGHNWHALVSSQPFSNQSGLNVLVVWESNRSGRGHIYSRVVPIYFDAIGDDPPHAIAFELLQNFPNPFNPSTTIRYALPGRCHVALSVFNTLGQVVATLVDESQEAGYHEVRFEGNSLASGVYFYRLRAGTSAGTKKLIYLR